MVNEAILICLFVLITGACIGSFLNVVALRALSGESIVFPASKCPKCNEPIKWYDNIPVLSYLFTFKGKCRNCGGKVSVQYPIVEAITSILFLLIFLFFGISLKTLCLLVLLCISIVITITDFRKECVYDVHSWVLIITAIATSLVINGHENYAIPAIGLIVGVIVMESIAKLSYYLVKKDEPQTEETQTEVAEDAKEENVEQKSEAIEENVESVEVKETEKTEEDIDINEYIKQNKRAFGEGDTYLAAAAGALLGWQYLIVAIVMAIIIQAVCILPQFLIGLYKQKENRLLISISAFVIISVLYWVASNVIADMHLYVVFAFILPLIYFAIDTITRLKKMTSQQGFVAIPFGPALLFSMFITFFFGSSIVIFLLKHIFMFAE